MGRGAALLALGLALASSARADPGADSSAVADTTQPRRVVREFPVLEVRALLHDLRSSETVHPIGAAALRSYPVDALAELVTLQPGVVAQAGELHVRGGRAGETLVLLEGIRLNEPLRHRPIELPMLALRSADLISGAPDARHAGSLAGILELHTEDPAERIAREWRWQTNAGAEGHYDRFAARVSAPLKLLGLGVVVAGDATLDDASLPDLRTHGRRRVAGMSFGWRADNRLLGYLKLAPVASPRRFSLQVAASRKVHEPFDPMWSLDGWTGFDGFGNPAFSDTFQAGFERYRAADHLAMTDERQLASLLTVSRLRAQSRATVALGWLRTRTARTPGGVHEIVPGPTALFLADPFHAMAGDDPLYRVGGSDAYQLRVDFERALRSGSFATGAGIDYQHVWQDELDLFLTIMPIDRLRRYDATAPGGFVYAQGRWETGGMVLNGGLRAEYFTAGPQADNQTLPGRPGAFSFSPRFGIAYPVSTRDVVSMSYARIQQEPQRDLLYDRRVQITNRQPLGNPGLRPPRMISYEGAVKHLFSAVWALQTSFFYRDAAFLAGARVDTLAGGRVDLRYTDDDQASSAGFELSLIHAGNERRRLEAHYAFLHAWGFESRPEGDPYGPIRDVRAAPIGERPLSWDRRHSILVSGTWQWRSRMSLSWSSVVGSGLPWTPKPRRVPFNDVGAINSRRFGWTETTSLSLRILPRYALGLEFGFEARNVFGTRGEQAASVDGYPNPLVNTVYDDYAAYRTETGQDGGAYWGTVGGVPQWIPVHDPRLRHPPRSLRASVGRRW